MGDITKVNDLLKAGETFCLATVIASDTADALPGSKTIVLPDGTLDGAAVSPSFAATLRDQALSALKAKKAASLKSPAGCVCF
ncbi:MAG: XdhC family protein [Deltaproteobacteria bacterium]|jgi:xanthine/CO dehydrogenase XdhC/CoxF family maturation factor|nr:XdhC family protein [Deltaproteobacteria bacterium]